MASLQQYVWEGDYGVRKPISHALKKILDNQPPKILQGVAVLVNNNPYNLEFFIVFNYLNPSKKFIEEMKGEMTAANAIYKPNIPFDRLSSALAKGRFDVTTFVDSSTVDLQLQTIFHYEDKEEVQKHIPMYNFEGEHSVFVGHSSNDKKEIKEFISYLNFDGLSVWFDEVSIDYGDSLVSKIQEGIENSSAVIFWITENFLKSLWCKTEMRSFLSRYSEGENLKIVCIVSNEVAHKQLPLFLRDIKYLKRGNLTIKGIVKEIVPSLKKHLNR